MGHVRGILTIDYPITALLGLLAKTNLPVVCTYQGAGVVPRELFDRFGGRVGLFHTQSADKLLDAADTVIAVGYDPIEYESSLWKQKAEHYRCRRPRGDCSGQSNVH